MKKKHELKKEKVVEFAILRDGTALQTELRDPNNVWEIYGFLKIYVKDLESFLLGELIPREDDEKDLY